MAMGDAQKRVSGACLTQIDARAGNSRAVPIIPEPEREVEKVAGVDSGCKPMAVDRLYPSSRTALNAVLRGQETIEE